MKRKSFQWILVAGDALALVLLGNFVPLFTAGTQDTPIAQAEEPRVAEERPIPGREWAHAFH